MINIKTKLMGNQLFLSLEGKDYNAIHYYYFNDPFFFINIPKNASSSVNEMVKLISIEQKKIKPFWFTVIRNPYERLISTFRYLSTQYNFDFELLSSSLKNFPTEQSNSFFWHFIIHFAPQHSFVDFFEKQNLDINYYNIDNLKNLSQDVYNLTGINFEIDHLNKSRRNSQLDDQIFSWIEKNKQFVDKFLEKDVIWFNNLMNR